MMDKRFTFVLATAMLLLATGAVGTAAATGAEANSLSTDVTSDNWCIGASGECSLGEAADEISTVVESDNWCIGASGECSLGEAADKLVTVPMNEHWCTVNPDC